jgi:hypothetical protein
MTRWEYLQVGWSSTAEAKPPPARSGARTDLRILRPGQETERLAPGRPLLDVINDLGAEGWELVSGLVQSSRIAKLNNWSEASTPVQMHWTFKRPIDT